MSEFFRMVVEDFDTLGACGAGVVFSFTCKRVGF